MTFKKNMKKILGEELAKKIYQYIISLKYRKEIKPILKTIDLKQFGAFQERYAGNSSSYLNIKYWLAQKLICYYKLDLHKRKPPLSILDIGTGNGYFPYVCNLFGHNAMAIDLDENQMFNEITGFLNIDRRICPVKPFKKLPDLGVRFNLITAFMMVFDDTPPTHIWGVKEWTFFMEDIVNNHLTEDGRIFFEFQTGIDKKKNSNEVSKYFHEKGARIDGLNVYFDSLEAFHE